MARYNGQSSETRALGRNQGSSYITTEDAFHFPNPNKSRGKLDSSLRPHFKKGISCVGGYSEDENGSIGFDNSYRKFLKVEYLPESCPGQKQVCIDLTSGSGTTKDYIMSSEKTFHNFLSWILCNPEIFKKKMGKSALGGKFVTSRSTLVNFMKTPYVLLSGRELLATCVDGLIYMVSVTRGATENMWKSDMAHKFKEMLKLRGNSDEPDCNKKYRRVLTSELGPHKLFYSSFVDCFNPELFDDDLKDLSAGVHLKCVEPETFRNSTLERFKMFQWCVEICLTGIPNIMVGYRNSEGQVYSINLFDEKTLVNKGKDYWNMDVCFTFLKEFLSFVQMKTESKPGAVFRFKSEPRQTVFNAFECKDSDFVPEWFTDDLKM